MAEKQNLTEKKITAVHIFWGQKGSKNRFSKKSFFTHKHDHISILSTKIKLSSLHRFIKFAKDGQNMTPWNVFFGDFFNKNGPKSQNFEKSLFTPKHGHMSTLCAKFHPCKPYTYFKLTGTEIIIKLKKCDFWDLGAKGV